MSVLGLVLSTAIDPPSPSTMFLVMEGRGHATTLGREVGVEDASQVRTLDASSGVGHEDRDVVD
ncbi:MAG: hypothetical protein U0Q11_03455 [Vicinamibacterales bacterium]